MLHLSWLLGHPDQALENLHEMLTLFEGSSNPYGLPVALLFAAILHQFRGEDAGPWSGLKSPSRFRPSKGFHNCWHSELSCGAGCWLSGSRP